ncbi:hypothetical protein G6321_00039260 [Bradyrhizobium barranii subsp. barranii]|uniref:Uncharacterized protein n=1 Tax=Bradyrhizobium barranii subsp. barranii TaxID=2823807 RepID=A0A7Z0QD57_9BRAD|nr:hypothetical protein [Bradyrhizobium barranii]UGX91741.1 hypothetical protein G6321_00039260 [Bradyrhizobium barranii subsp. barranii]
MGTFFSDTFGVDPSVVEKYGAFDVSLINDLPLFIDPFLLFHSESDEYQALHRQIIDYLVFLRERAIEGPLSDGDLTNWYCFPEVKQNWFGFSLVGNGGSGLGINFARELHANLHVVFVNFGEEKITEGSHLEKVCLVSNGVGRDNISDFVTNLIQDFLCQYTERFAAQFLDARHVREVTISRAVFNYTTQTWQRKTYKLPWIRGDFVLLTPRAMLTRDDTWINRADLLGRFDEIPTAIPDAALRAAVSNYFDLALRQRVNPRRPPTQKDKTSAAASTVRQFPELIDYYIKLKEMHGEDAVDLSAEKVLQAEIQFSRRLKEILQPLLAETEFYKIAGGTYAEAHTRVAYLKHVIEDNAGWRIFYDDDGKPFKRENDLQILYRLVWFGTPLDVGQEANDGRGPVDFKASRGRHKTLVEMKLASNTKLEANLRKQVEIYQISADAERGLKVIIFFSYQESQKVDRILKKLGLRGHKDVILIDARSDNKPSASRAK